MISAEAIYPYQDENGVVLYEVIRSDNKRFRQRQPVGTAGYIDNVQGVRKIPYRLPELAAGINSGKPVFFVEGEKDVDRLISLGLCATTVSGGAKQSREAVLRNLPELFESFFENAARVVVIADADAAGHTFASTVAETLAKTVSDVRLIGKLPFVEDKGDVSDYLDAGYSVADLLELVEQAETLSGFYAATDPLVPDQQGEDVVDNVVERRKQCERLIDYVDALGVQLSQDAERNAYARYALGSHQEFWPIRSLEFARFLRKIVWDHERSAFTAQAYQDALAVLESRALFEGSLEQVYLRVGRLGETIYVDLCDDGWRVVEIDRAGWRVISSAECPVRFLRRKGMLPLPTPESGGSISDLRGFINVSDAEFPLVLAWLVAALKPEGPYPILCFTAEQGSGKSTATRLLRSLIDPNVAPLRAEIRDVRNLAIAAKNGWCLAFDNVSYVSGDLSDALCRLSTGGGFSTRQLYTDDEETLFNSQRPAVLTSIEDIASRADLLDRTLIVRLLNLESNQRSTESSLLARFESIRPRLFGCLVNAVSCALSGVSEVARQLGELPRMADFAQWAAAAAPALGFEAQAFFESYAQSQDDGQSVALDSSPIVAPLRLFHEENPDWTGIASQLLAKLAGYSPDVSHGRSELPRTAKKIAGELRRLAPNLRAVGIDVSFHKGAHGARLIRIRTVGKNSATFATSATSSDELELEYDRTSRF